MASLIDKVSTLIKANLHALDADHQVRIDALVQHTSQDLQTLFSRRGVRGVALATIPLLASATHR